MKKFLVSLLFMAFLCAGLFAACANNEEKNTAPQEYSITAESHSGYSLEAPSRAKAGDTVEIIVKTTQDIYVVESVTANTVPCTAGENGVYTFTMPAENVNISVSIGYVQTEILSDGVLSWRNNAPSQIAKAQEGDESWALQYVYFDFSEFMNVSSGNGVEVISLNPDVISQDALSVYSLHKRDDYNGYCDWGSIRIELGKVSLGTAYVALHVKNSSATVIDATIIKKIEVVNYGEIEPEYWDETVKIDLSDVFGKYEGITVQVSDADRQYGAPSNLKTVVPETEVVEFDIEYIVGHNYHINVFFKENEVNNYLRLSESVTGQYASYLDGNLTFTLAGQTIQIDVYDEIFH